jgi:hypothetical protein
MQGGGEANLPIIGYWNIRGMMQPIRYALEYMHVKYEDKTYEQGDAPEFSR